MLRRWALPIDLRYNDLEWERRDGVTAEERHRARADEGQRDVSRAGVVGRAPLRSSAWALGTREPVITAAIVATGLSFAAVMVLTRDVAPAFTFGLVLGAIVIGADPKWCWGGAVLLLLSAPILIALGATSFAEDVARTAFYLLASGLVLEFRAGLSRPGWISRD